MRLPDAARFDLLEFVGATPLADVVLQELIDTISAKLELERTRRPEPN